jgi:tetratricopeptide (TPR) repeat protein
MKKKNKSVDFLSKNKYYVLSGILLLTIIIYLKSLPYPFHFDDVVFIEGNANIIENPNLAHIFETYKLRTVAFTSFAVNQMINGENPLGFRIINIIIHLINTALVFQILINITSINKFKIFNNNKEKILFSIIISGIFALHPIQTQSIVYIYQRLASLAALFYLSSIFFFLKFKMSSESKKRNQYLISMIISIVLGMFTKENFYSIPLMLITINIFFFNSYLKQQIKYLVPFIILIVSGSAYLLSSDVLFRMGYTGYYYTGEQITSFNYLMSQFSVLLKYFKLLIIPMGQNIDHDHFLATSFFDMKVILPLILHILIVSFAIFKYKSNKLFTFGIFWFYVSIAIESSIIPIHDLVFEHRLYMPMIGFFISTFALFFEFIKSKKIIRYVSIAMITMFSLVTFFRIGIWRTNESLWEDSFKKSPNKVRPYKNVAHYQYLNHDYSEAIDNYSKGIKNLQNHLDNILNQTPQWNINTSLQIYKDRGLAHMQVNQYNAAINDFSFFIDNTVDNYVYFERGQAYKLTGKFQLAILDLNNFLEKYKKEITYKDVVYKEIGYNYLRLQKYDNAIENLKIAVKLNDKNDKYYNYIGFCYFQKGDYFHSIKYYQKALELNPNSKDIKENIKKAKFLFDKKKNM